MRRSVFCAAIAASLLVACGGGHKGGNALPVVSAGTDQSVATGALVSLQGTATDANTNDILAYHWEFVSLPAGSQTVLMNPETLTPSFVADIEGDYDVELVVDDGHDHLAASSVKVSAVGQIPTDGAPVADAGQAVTAAVNGQLANDPGAAVLDGSGSSDPDGDPIVYLWSIVAKPTGSVALLNDPTYAKPTLFVDKAGSYTVALQVYDGVLWSAPAMVQVGAAGASVVTIVGGNAQVQMVGSTLAQPLVVKATNEFGNAVAGLEVDFSPAVGGGLIVGSGVDVTGTNGQAHSSWTLGTVTGGYQANATVVTWTDVAGNRTTLAPATFDATATSGPAVNLTITATDTTSVDGTSDVHVTGVDLYGNPAVDDNATYVTLNASGSATFAMNADAGAVITGGGTNAVTLKVAAGVAEIQLADTAVEVAEISTTTAAYTSATVGPFPLPPYFDTAAGTLQAFAFDGVPSAFSDGTLTISGRGAFGGGNGLTIFDGENIVPVGEVFDSAPTCSTVPSVESITIDAGELNAMVADGTAAFFAGNFGGFPATGCPVNDFSATLSYTAGAAPVSTSFTTGALSKLILTTPVDVIAGSPMSLDAWTVDQYGNLETSDDATQFSIAASGTAATFASNADTGLLVAGAGSNKAYLRVSGGHASIQVSDPNEELETYTLGDAGAVTVGAPATGRFTGAPNAVVLISGDAQNGTVGEPVTNPIVVEVRDAGGYTIPGQAVFFAPNVNSPFTTDNPAMTDATGRASTTLVLGGTAGANAMTATVAGASTSASFTATGMVAAPAMVVLKQVTPPAAGVNDATVRVEIQDAFGNLVPTDNGTQFTVQVNGSGVFPAAITGSILAGAGTHSVLVQDTAGVVEIDLSDAIDETVTVTHFDSLGNGYSYPTEGGTVTVPFTP